MIAKSERCGALNGILVHEWLSATGGSENVFEAISAIFPDAARYCLWDDSEGRFAGVGETWLAQTPLRRSKAVALPFMPLAWRQLPAVEADWVLCSNHVFAHHARFSGSAGDAPKLVYAHTPARYVWVPELDGRGNNPVARAVSAKLRPLDRRRAQEPVALAANSRFVAERIAVAWERESTVIYPPVEVGAFSAEPDGLTAAESATMAALPSGYLLGASRFVPYKQLDRVIDVGVAAGVPVVLAGEGPDEPRLREIAGAHPGLVTFVPRPSFPLLRALYHRSLALVFAPIEDFGIMPVEAMATGTPVIANAIGGAAETVVDCVTGALVSEWSPSELAHAVDVATSASPDACRARAREFDASVFADRVRQWVAAHV